MDMGDTCHGKLQSRTFQKTFAGGAVGLSGLVAVETPRKRCLRNDDCCERQRRPGSTNQKPQGGSLNSSCWNHDGSSFVCVSSSFHSSVVPLVCGRSTSNPDRPKQEVERHPGHTEAAAARTTGIQVNGPNWRLRRLRGSRVTCAEARA